MPATFFNGIWYQHGSWSCAHCGLWHRNSSIDLFKGLHVPSKEWARQAGFPVQDGRWLEVHPPAPKLPKVAKKPKRLKPRGLFDVPAPEYREREPFEDIENRAGDSLDDWSA